MLFTQEGFEMTWNYKQLFIDGLVCTVSLSLLTVIFGFILALMLAVMRLSKWHPFGFLALDKNGHLREEGLLSALGRFNPLSFIASVYIEVFRATPMLVQLFIIYYIAFDGVDLPSIKIFGTIRFERFVPGVVALSLNSAAYLSEIIRSGIQSVDGRSDRGCPFARPYADAEHALYRPASGYKEHFACYRKRVCYDN